MRRTASWKDQSARALELSLLTLANHRPVLRVTKVVTNMQKKQLIIGIIIGMVLYFVTSTVIELFAPQMDLVVRCVIMVAVALVAIAVVYAVLGRTKA